MRYMHRQELGVLIEGLKEPGFRKRSLCREVGQAVTAVTGAYLAGRWIYDNYDSAKNIINDTSHLIKDGGRAAVDGLAYGDWSKLGDEVDHFGDVLARQGRQIKQDVIDLAKNARDLALGAARELFNDPFRSGIYAIKSLF